MLGSWRIIERTILVLGAVIAGSTLYFTAAAYYHWDVPSVSPSPVGGGITMVAPWWVFILGAISILLLVTGWAMLFARRGQSTIERRFPTKDWEKPLKQIYRQEYKNETVQLDGKEFIECNFKNVTFVYEGTQPMRLIKCGRVSNATDQNEFIFNTGNPIVYMVVGLFGWFSETAPDKHIALGGSNIFQKDKR